MRSTGGMEPLPLHLPTAPPPPRRTPAPYLAAIVPIVAGVLMWLLTRSALALAFAALGPLMMAASLLDGLRFRRRERRRLAAQAERDWRDAEEELRRRHREERDALRRRFPDALDALEQPPLREALTADADLALVVGRGTVPSAVRCSGGDDRRGRGFRERASVLRDAPVVVPLGGGVCVRGPRSLADAVLRALVAQASLRFGAPQLSISGPALDRLGFGVLPHRASAGRAAVRVAVAASGERHEEADALLCIAEDAADVPEGVTTVIEISEPATATVRTPAGVESVTVECLSAQQAERIAQVCAERQRPDETVPAVVALDELAPASSGDGLAATIGRGPQGEVTVDIVHDGPHALVTGITGAGKSELLVTWVSAMAAVHGPDRVAFVLADFKGGTAFEPLRELCQVAAVVTDLDDLGARRGVASLRAELRRREAVLAAAGARDIRQVDMPRLVIVVDEFAALLQEHPDLGAVFTDVAARGRALGMHLILGTQRASGVVRDALAANCPLRLSLRVADPADSRLMLGSTAAADLPGDPASRGLAVLRRPADHDPVLLRVALTGAADLRRLAVAWGSADRPSSPWLPPLPALLPLSALRRGHKAEGIVLGLADTPEQQEQPLEVLHPGRDRGLAVLGAPGSGRSTVLRTVARQDRDACWMPQDPEQAWDCLATWTDGSRPPALVLCDDLDVLIATFPAEHAAVFVQRLERLVRSPGELTVVLSATKASGQVGRLLDAFPRRVLLRMATRIDHLTAGGDPEAFTEDRLPGRARIGRREVQLAWTDADASGAEGPPAPRQARWRPGPGVTALVTPGSAETIARLRAAYPDCEVVATAGEPTGAATAARLVVADAESWQREWSAWRRIRAEGEVLVPVEQPGDLRQLVGVREVPPYAHRRAGRAWAVRGTDAPRRVVIGEAS